MVLWCQRPLGYKIGFFGLIVSGLLYIVAYALPYWAVLRLAKYDLVDQTVGLWQACLQPSNTCISNVHSSNPMWINVARAMCSIGLILLVGALWCGYYRNFTRAGQERCRSPGRHIEFLSITAALLGAAGSVIFAFQFHVQYVRRAEVGRLYWGFPFLCSSLCLLALSAALMLFFNRDRYHLQRSTSTVRLRGPQGLPVMVQFSGEVDDHLHIPYFGEISREQMVSGAAPLQPPSYELVTGTSGSGMGGSNYTAPPGDVSEAPPLYEDIGKDSVLPPEVVAQLQREDKATE